MNFTPVVFQFVAEHHPFGEEEGEAGAFVHNGEEAEFLTDPAMISLFRFFQQMEILIQLGFFGEGSAVYALEHLVLFVAPPVSTGNGHHFHGFDLFRGGQMRPGAEIEKTALLISADFSVFGQIVDEFHFILFAAFFKIFQRFFSGNDFFRKLTALGGETDHFLFDGFKIVFAEGVLRIEIVVKTVFDGGADPEFRTGEKILHRFGQQMGAAVTEHIFPFVIVPGENFQRDIMVKNGIQIHDFAVHFAGEGVFGQFVADAVGHVKNGYTVFITTAVAVGECNCNAHFIPP